MKILIGGIPLGCDNIGDEAILAGVVKMLKSSIPGVELTVATADPATAERLGVAVAPGYGFARTPLHQDGNRAAFAVLARAHDAYVWAGATGLSDYPNVALDLLETAQSVGTATYIWGVGMDDQLNPAFFKAHGNRRLLLGLLGLNRVYERVLRRRLARRLAALLPRCRGVWLRDYESVAALTALGLPAPDVAADSAILLAPEKPARAPHGRPVLGLCLSAQRPVSDYDGAKRLVADVRASGADVLGIPMNPKTDKAILEQLGVTSASPCNTPEDVMAAAAKCDVVLSSRLHLLILAANVGTPGLGIARGSKLANWLRNFGMAVEGSVDECDWSLVTTRVLAALASRDDFDTVRDAAYVRLNARLETARCDFIKRLTA